MAAVTHSLRATPRRPGNFFGGALLRRALPPTHNLQRCPVLPHQRAAGRRGYRDERRQGDEQLPSGTNSARPHGERDGRARSQLARRAPLRTARSPSRHHPLHRHELEGLCDLPDTRTEPPPDGQVMAGRRTLVSLYTRSPRRRRLRRSDWRTPAADCPGAQHYQLVLPALLHLLHGHHRPASAPRPTFPARRYTLSTLTTRTPSTDGVRSNWRTQPQGLARTADRALTTRTPPTCVCPPPSAARRCTL